MYGTIPDTMSTMLFDTANAAAYDGWPLAREASSYKRGTTVYTTSQIQAILSLTFSSIIYLINLVFETKE